MSIGLFASAAPDDDAFSLHVVEGAILDLVEGAKAVAIARLLGALHEVRCGSVSRRLAAAHLEVPRGRREEVQPEAHEEDAHDEAHGLGGAEGVELLEENAAGDDGEEDDVDRNNNALMRLSVTEQQP